MSSRRHRDPLAIYRRRVLDLRSRLGLPIRRSEDDQDRDFYPPAKTEGEAYLAWLCFTMSAADLIPMTICWACYREWVIDGDPSLPPEKCASPRDALMYFDHRTIGATDG